MRRIGGNATRVALAVLAMVVAIPVTAAARMPGGARAATAAVVSPLAARAGIATGNWVLWQSDAELAADLDAIARTGARWVRFDVDWNSTQHGGAHSWNWAAIDRFVVEARRRSLAIIGMLAYTPPWARPAGCVSLKCLPADPQAFAAFAAAAARRYGPGSDRADLRGAIRAWEIWNEPNHLPFAQPAPDPVAYTRLLQAAYRAVKSVDPGATVITGGLAPAPDAPGRSYQPGSFLWAMYEAGAKGSFDAVGHHPYAYPFNPLNGKEWNAFTQTRDLHAIMRLYGDGTKKVWGTEAGAPTGTADRSVSEAQQAQWVRDYYTGWVTTFGSFTGPLLWYQHRNTGSDPRSLEANFGLLRRDWSAKPSYLVFTDLMRRGVEMPAPGLPVAVTGGRRVVMHPRSGFYVLRPDGQVVAHGGAPDYGSPRFGFDAARGLAVMPDGAGYVVLDAYGGLWRYGSATRGPVGAARLPYFGWDIARDVAITPDGRGIAVLDGWGGVHGAGSAPRVRSGYWPGWDIARALAFTRAGAVVLDGFGGLWRTGSTPAGRTPYFGWDIARDLVVSPSGRGVAVLDGFGGVHAVGDAPRAGGNPDYAAADRFRGVALSSGRYLTVR
jgi:hypothetical protein